MSFKSQREAPWQALKRKEKRWSGSAAYPNSCAPLPRDSFPVHIRAEGSSIGSFAGSWIDGTVFACACVCLCVLGLGGSRRGGITGTDVRAFGQQREEKRANRPSRCRWSSLCRPTTSVQVHIHKRWGRVEDAHLNSHLKTHINVNIYRAWSL